MIKSDNDKVNGNFKKDVMLERDGKIYARVSDIIRPFGSFSHINPQVLANKARIGTNVHMAIVDEFEGNFPILKDDEIGYFESYLKWKEQINPSFVQMEQRYFCEVLMITGQIDALITMPYEQIPVILDFKTSAAESPITWKMQGHLYMYLLTQNKFKVGTKFLFLRLDKTGKLPTLHSYSFDSNTFNKCLHAVVSFWSSDKN